EMASRLPSEPRQTLLRALRNLGPVVATLHAVYEQMRFDRDNVVVQAGKPVVLILQNDDAMPHNLAILAPGALKEIGLAAEKMNAEPDSEGRMYVPVSPKVLHATRLVSPGQRGQLAFDAPSETGDYPFVCTFPGHWLRMSGTLKVVADLEAFLAHHGENVESKFTEWKIDELAADLRNPEAPGNATAGRELFARLACVQCHRLGSTGYSYGPDLAGVFQRYNNDRVEVLRQILEPSRIIADQYRNVRFDLKDGDSVVGMVVKEDDATCTIQTGPADSLIQKLNKSEIKARRPQASSPMPSGLLGGISKSQILDLLAFLQSGGQISQSAHEHKH
ncbi:MAG TPA: plastocyanin/azurin family copper-binding protein, partial [Verrucomicrobiae bacterium]|nr:plastocyanin/azurin family copper-binding protein [Verrucomicrobiae bacterium]